MKIIRLGNMIINLDNVTRIKLSERNDKALLFWFINNDDGPVEYHFCSQEIRDKFFNKMSFGADREG